MSYELLLFRAKNWNDTSTARGTAAEGGTSLDEGAIGEFLLALGPHVRFQSHTALGEQYVYEDEQGCAVEIVISEKQVALGCPTDRVKAVEERARRIVKAVALALVARFDLTMYDPQRKCFIRATRQVGEQ